MKNVSTMILALALSAVVITGCGGEKKQSAQKAQEAVKEAPPAMAVEKPAETTETAPVATVGTKEKAAVEETAAKVEEKVESAAASVEKAAVKVEEKAAETVAAMEKAVETPMEKPADDGKLAEAGSAIFMSKCLPCHGPGGKGTAMAPAFVGNEWIKGAAKADIASVIKNGRAGGEKKYSKFVIAMPAQKGMADSDIAALVEYIKSIN